MATIVSDEVVVFVERCNTPQEWNSLFWTLQFKQQFPKATAHRCNQCPILSTLRDIQNLAERCLAPFDLTAIEQVKCLLKLFVTTVHN